MQLRVNELMRLKRTINIAKNAPVFRGCLLQQSKEMDTVQLQAGTILIVREINESFLLDNKYGISWPAHILLTPEDDEYTPVVINLIGWNEFLEQTGKTMLTSFEFLLTNYIRGDGIDKVVAYTTSKEGVELVYEVKEKNEEGLAIKLTTDLDLSSIRRLVVHLVDDCGECVYLKTESGDFVWDIKQSDIRVRLGEWFDNPRGKRYLRIVS